MCYRYIYFSSDLNLIKVYFFYNFWKLDVYVYMYIILDNIFYYIFSIRYLELGKSYIKRMRIDLYV